MANILRGIVVLLAVTAVLDAASVEEQPLSPVEDAPSNLGKAASADDTATDQSRDLVEDPADMVESEGRF